MCIYLQKGYEMKIGDKIRIHESIAGKSFSYDAESILEVTQSKTDETHIAFDLAESLMRGGVAEAATFPEEIHKHQGTNESPVILPDYSANEPEPISHVAPAENGLHGHNDNAGQSLRTRTGSGVKKRATRLRKNAPNSLDSGV